jgi:hypothetical protein
MRPQIPAGPLRSPRMPKKLLPAGDTKPSAHTHTGLFGTQYLHGQLYLLPLHLASFRAYASIELSPAHLQGSIPGPWLAVTWVGLSPTRLRGLARPQPWPVPYYGCGRQFRSTPAQLRRPTRFGRLCKRNSRPCKARMPSYQCLLTGHIQSRARSRPRCSAAG